MSVRAVLFDIDGTLADSNGLHVRAWMEAFEARGLPATPEAIHAQIGKGADLLVPALVPGADDQLAKTLGDEHGAIFQARYLDQVKPFPGAHDLLARCKVAGQRVVLASSASRAELDHYVRLLDAADLVDAGTSIDDVRTSKPAPDIFAVALDRAGAGAGEAVAVGDSPYDVQGAGKCGVVTLAVRSGGFADEALLAAGARVLYDDVEALLVDYDASVIAF